MITIGTIVVRRQLCELLPYVDFRQTFGMSELGIVRVKSESRNSLFMKVGGEGVETRVIQDYLGHKNIAHSVVYTELSDTKFKGLWK